MRKLILQMQITIDGFVAGPNGELDWMWSGGKRDEALFQKVIDLAYSCDTLLLGRIMTPGFVQHWEKIYDTVPESPEHYLAKQMVNIRKIAFSRTRTTIPGRNLEVENGDLSTAVETLKKEPGKDILVYGGADFVSSLIGQNLIDEYYLFVNPVAIGKGLTIFKEQKMLELVSSTTYKHGKLINRYLPVKL